MSYRPLPEPVLYTVKKNPWWAIWREKYQYPRLTWADQEYFWQQEQERDRAEDRVRERIFFRREGWRQRLRKRQREAARA